tara:strand:- start:138 stop:419 length:282 start_codon:yes stop_codon:yes gene_type:complete
MNEPRSSDHLNNQQILAWAFANKIYISSHAVWNDDLKRPQDLRIIVKYWGFTTKGKLLWSQRKKDIHLITNRIKEMYRYYYETYLENPDEIKV